MASDERHRSRSPSICCDHIIRLTRLKTVSLPAGLQHGAADKLTFTKTLLNLTSKRRGAGIRPTCRSSASRQLRL